MRSSGHPNHKKVTKHMCDASVLVCKSLLTDGCCSDACAARLRCMFAAMDAAVADEWFAEVVDLDLGKVEGNSCILFSAIPIGDHKIVVRVEPQDLGLLAALVHENCFELSCVACAKLYKSDVLLLVVCLAPGAAEDTHG